MALRLTRRGRLVTWLALAVVGAAFGIVVSAVNHGFGPASAYVSKVVGNGWVWLTAGLGACLLGRSWKRSWLSGVVFFWPAVVGYDLADVAAGVYTSPPFADPTAPAQLDLPAVAADIVQYAVLAALASALLAVVVLAARRGGIVGLLGAVAVPGYVACAALTLDHGLRALPAKFQDPVDIAVNRWLGLVALGVAVLVVVTRLGRLPRPRGPGARGGLLSRAPRNTRS
jgi:hypothetical protein